MATMFRRERATPELLVEMAPLFEEHAKEASELFKSPKPDTDLYLALEKAGKLRVYVSRKGCDPANEIAGYQFFMLAPHPHNLRVMVATETLIYVRPAYRGEGPGFMRLADAALRKEAKFITRVSPAKKDHEKAFKRAGYQKLETVYVREA